MDARICRDTWEAGLPKKPLCFIVYSSYGVKYNAEVGRSIELTQEPCVSVG